MGDDLISVIDLAKGTGQQKSRLFKILERLEIDTVKQHSSRSRGQKVACLTTEQAALVRQYLESEEGESATSGTASAEADAELGVFYLIVLEPEHDPGRFKVGFTKSLAERLRHLRCSAPLLKTYQVWPCKRLWEKTAIDAVTQQCERLNIEVFRADSIEKISNRCEQFFSLMPKMS